MKYIELPFPLPTLNEYISGERANKYIGAKIKREATNKCVPFFNGVKFKTPIELEILWVVKDRRKDYDNIAFAKKFILDAMVKAGAIPNDGQKYVSGTRGEHVVVGEKECVLIKIYEEG
jgi:Holliday junction resolvase RusA-like endonuclease